MFPLVHVEYWLSGEVTSAVGSVGLLWYKERGPSQFLCEVSGMVTSWAADPLDGSVTF